MLSIKCFKIPVRLSYPAVALFTLSVIISGKDSMICLCLFCSVFHELGHLFLICRFCGKPRGISVNLGDIAIESDTTCLSKSGELLIDIAGPISNFLLSLLTILLYFFTNAPILLNLCLCSLFIGLFNLLPLKSLDGGNILYNILTNKFTLKTADTILNIISVIFIIPFLVGGFLILFISKYNYSLLLIAIYLILLISNKEMR